ncbi:hypothetical protein GCM10010869_02970 [Mesorhizobium tianshanense]|uniref:Type III secretion system (T3SS) protein YscO n=1 Tax=Mesorhizobium tianshanense TaxID=39844 RepID=A0A562PBW1_9HYPH|nr:YscO family type III secretion system apparatus protein [Mesorhizobium tianshanense]TWI41965.1 type III secretion system (T3SS) protein YscO [Mesorhizobium tianshanense]GLS34709.1 hypothetical protein GCM10010869_02970 [Mesorhizobium tianshanense]
MKEHEMISRLRDLRRRREQRSQNMVIRSQAEARRAANDVQQTTDAIAAHRRRAVADEQAAFDAMIGQPVTMPSLHRLQGKFEKAAAQAMQLEDSRREAGAAEEKCNADLAEARRRHNSHFKAVTKLDRLLEQLTRRAAGRQTAITELGDEDDRGGMPASGDRS